MSFLAQITFQTPYLAKYKVITQNKKSRTTNFFHNQESFSFQILKSFRSLGECKNDILRANSLAIFHRPNFLPEPKTKTPVNPWVSHSPQIMRRLFFGDQTEDFFLRPKNKISSNILGGIILDFFLKM